METNADINLYVIKTNGRDYILPYFMDGVLELMKFMNLVLYKDLLFYNEPKEASRVSAKKRISVLGMHIEQLNRYGQLYSSEYTFSPLIAFFFEQYRKHSIHDCALTLDKVDPDGFDSELFDDFIRTMRCEAAARKLKKAIIDWNRKFELSRIRMAAFEAKLFEKYARLMVIRLDFDYRKAIFTEEELKIAIDEAKKRKESDLINYLAGADPTLSGAIEGRVTLQEVQKDRDRLFGNMKGKPSLFRHLAGYVWRIEYTRLAGYHMHVMLFFDGENVKNHQFYAQEIGNYWRDVVTEGRGYFENCNRNKSRYGEAWALGLIDHWDGTKRDKLRKAMEYFSKMSQIVHVMPYPKCRLFQCVFARRQGKKAGGRPRTRGFVRTHNQGAPG